MIVLFSEENRINLHVEGQKNPPNLFLLKYFLFLTLVVISIFCPFYLFNSDFLFLNARSITVLSITSFT